MTVRAHQLAVRDFGLDSIQAVSLADQLADLRPLRSNMVELEHGRVRKATISARPGAEDPEHILARDRAPLVASAPALPPV
jgi:hypothetical protein